MSAVAEQQPDARRAALAKTVTRQMTFGLVAANVLGGGLVAVFLFLVVPLPVARGLGQTADLVAAPAFLLGGVLVGPFLGRRAAAPVTEWLQEERTPDTSERELALRQALRQAANVGALWAIAVVLFVAVNAFYSAALALEVGVTVAMGGIVTTSLCYLLSERIGRPVMALALSEQPPLRSPGTHWPAACSSAGRGARSPSCSSTSSARRRSPPLPIRRRSWPP